MVGISEGSSVSREVTGRQNRRVAARTFVKESRILNTECGELALPDFSFVGAPHFLGLSHRLAEKIYIFGNGRRSQFRHHGVALLLHLCPRGSSIGRFPRPPLQVLDSFGWLLRLWLRTQLCLLMGTLSPGRAAHHERHHGKHCWQRFRVGTILERAPTKLSCRRRRRRYRRLLGRKIQEGRRLRRQKAGRSTLALAFILLLLGVR